MIKNINIKNFKCLKNIQFDCRKLNIFTGINSMGKSSTIQALLILRQSYQKGLLNIEDKYIAVEGNLTSIGTYRDALYYEFDKEEDYIEFSILFSDYQALWRTQSYYKLGDITPEIPLIKTPENFEVYKESLFAKGKFQFLQAERLGPRDFLLSNDRYVANKDFGIDGAYAMNYFIEKAAKQTIPIEKLAHFSEKNLLLESQMNAWLSEISPSISVQSIFHTDKIISKFGYSTDGIPRGIFKAKNIGFGVSYIFSVVLAILTAEPNDLIIIENPEAHLHPRGQSNLAQLMGLAAQNGVQIFVETHSDHIINGVLVACKKGLISNENIGIQYFDRKENELYSENIEVKVLEKGRIKYAPNGFFDQIAKDLRFLMTSQK